jgi:signal transduction histidine kinase
LGEQARREDLLRVLDTADSVVKQQGEALRRRDCVAPPAPGALGELALQIAQNRGESAGQNALLYALFSELNERQLAITALDRATADEVSNEALVAVAHRIRTALDVVLACSGEIEDLTEGPADPAEVRGVALEIGLCARWVLQYANELNDLAMLSKAKPLPHVLVYADELIAAVAARLSALARYSNVAIRALPGDRIGLFTAPQPLERCLQHLALQALSSSGVRNVTLSAMPTLVEGVAEVAFIVEDDGQGASLGERAELQATSPITGEGARTADGAGYGLARRLARSLGGAIQLEIVASKGAKAVLMLPRNG